MSQTHEQDFHQIVQSLSSKQSDILLRAYELSQKAHQGQKRKSWEPYFIHPLAVAIALWNRFQDVELTAAWLLHDAVEDCEELAISQIYEDFWKNIGYIVDSVTKTEPTFYWEDKVYENERDKMLAGWMKNISCILVKLADREHNLATLKYMPAEKQIKKSFESQGLYLPLMHILWFSEDGLSLQKCKWLFLKYVTENKLTTFKEIKHKLLNVCFTDFDEELFDIVYNNTANLVWRITEPDVFNDLVANGWFDNANVSIQWVSVDSNGKFSAEFIYTNWLTMSDWSGKVNIAESKFIW